MSNVQRSRLDLVLPARHQPHLPAALPNVQPNGIHERLATPIMMAWCEKRLSVR
jgi:hypothetical protein